MERRTLLVLVVVLLVVGLALVFGLVPRLQQAAAPTPERAFVGIEVDGSGVAEVGPVEIEAGTPFRLHAVLQARTRQGEEIFFSEAKSLVVEGERIEPPTVRRYDLSPDARLLWFTIEGNVPYLELEAEEQVDRFRMSEFFRPEWGRSWSVEGSLDSLNDAQLEAESPLTGERDFGTQRYQVWIELFSEGNSLVADQRFKSPAADRVEADLERFPTVVARLPGIASAASQVFGLTQIEPPPAAPEELLRRLAELATKGLAFTRLTVLRDQIRAAGKGLDALPWRRVDLAAGPEWGGDGVASGDLLRVGSRVVVAFQDRGTEGRLDVEDLCFDFEQGASIRELQAVFVGEGEVEWASLDSHEGE